MKKLVCFIIMSALLFAFVPAAQAAGTPRFYVDAPANASAGSTVTVKLCIEGEYEAHLMTIKLKYNESALEYVSLVKGEVLQEASSNGMVICEKADNEPIISTGVLYVGDPGLSMEGVLFEATFKVLATAQLSVDVVEFGYMPVSAATAESIRYTADGATITVGGSGSSTTQPPATNVPIATPSAPGVTEGAQPTAAPGSTEANATEGAPSGSEAADSTPLPVLDPDTGKPGGNTKIDENPITPDDRSDDPAGEKDNAGGSNALRAVLIAVGCLLAVGLGWLGVFFLKRGRAAHNEAKRK